MVPGCEQSDEGVKAVLNSLGATGGSCQPGSSDSLEQRTPRCDRGSNTAASSRTGLPGSAREGPCERPASASGSARAAGARSGLIPHLGTFLVPGEVESGRQGLV